MCHWQVEPIQYQFETMFTRFLKHTILKVKCLAKYSILTKPQHFHEFFPFLTIFLVKSKLSTAKKSKTSTFSRVFHRKKIDTFLGKSKLNFWTKNEDFEQCASSDFDIFPPEIHALGYHSPFCKSRYDWVTFARNNFRRSISKCIVYFRLFEKFSFCFGFSPIFSCSSLRENCLSHVIILIWIILVPFHVISVNKAFDPLFQIWRFHGKFQLIVQLVQQ